MLDQEENYPSSPTDDFNRLFEGLIGALFIFNGINLVQKLMFSISVLVKASLMLSSIHNQK